MSRRKGPPQNHRRPYTDEDGEQIRDLFAAGYGLSQVARRLKRSVYGIRWYLQRENTGMTDLRSQIGMPVYTAAQAAAIMNVTTGMLIGWIRAGFIDAARPPKRSSRQQFLISSEQFLAFLERRDTWMVYDPCRITDEDYRQYALSARAVAGGHWMKVRYVAERLGYSESHALRRAKQGWYCTAIKRTCPDGGGWHWFIWSAEVEAIERGEEYVA